MLWLTLCHVKCCDLHCDLHCVMWSVVTYMLCHVQCCDLHSCCWMLWLTLYQSYYVCYEWLWLCNYVLYFVNFALANTFNFLLPINFSSSHPLVRPIQEYPPMVVIGIHQKSMLVVSVDCAMPGCDSCVMLSCDPLWHCDTSEGRWPGRPRTVSSSTYLDTAAADKLLVAAVIRWQPEWGKSARRWVHELCRAEPLAICLRDAISRYSDTNDHFLVFWRSIK